MKNAILFLLTAVVCTMTCSESTANMVLNPGFESSLTSWTRLTGGNWTLVPTIDTATKRSGANSLKIVGSGTGYGGEVQGIAVEPGKTNYAMAGWIKTSGLSSGWVGMINVDFYSSSYGYLGSESAGSVSGTADWTYVRKNFDVPANTAYMSVYCALLRVSGTSSNTGTVWIDDLNVWTGDILQNTGFESSLTSWTRVTGGNYTLVPTIDTATKHSGANSLKIVGSGT
ncbi:MAG: hypothetical protein ACYC0V_20800, partial [Armatimonadota bacterium]